MNEILSSQAMKDIDAEASNGDVQQGFEYMKKAALGLFDYIERIGINKKNDTIAIVCGKGNNGGDGYMLGALLLAANYRTTCFALCAGDELSNEARLAFDCYCTAYGKTVPLQNSKNRTLLKKYTHIVDGLLGVGIQGDPSGLYAEAITAINESTATVIAIDTPSGVDTDTGKCSKTTVIAQHCICMGFYKIGQLFYPARSVMGSTEVINLNYPCELLKKHTINCYTPHKLDLKKIVPQRKQEGSKFDHGVVLLVAGSRGMLGSITLAAQAAMRSGCGLVRCAIARSSLETLSCKLTEPVLHPLTETPEGSLSLGAFEDITQLSQSVKTVLIGCGLSRNAETTSLVRRLIRTLKQDVILDADGLTAFKENPEELKKHAGDLIITPHQGEWERLFGTLDPDPLTRINCLVAKAHEYNMCIVYKGNPSIVACQDGNSYSMPVGNSGMATAGSGDVLAGMITSFNAQGCSLQDAALLSVALHGRAGEIASDELSEYCTLASDVILKIPAALKELLAE